MLADEPTARPYLVRPSAEAAGAVRSPGEEFRATLLSVTGALSHYSGLQMSRHSAGSPEWWPWERISKVLYGALADLQEPAPLGERLVGRAALLAMISDGLDLVAVDRDFHFLLSVYMQACVLINLMNGECVAGDRDPVQETAFRKRIHASLDFVSSELVQLAALSPAPHRSAARQRTTRQATQAPNPPNPRQP